MAIKKQHYYKTATIKGLHRCYVGIIEYNEARDTYLARTPYTEKWFAADELENFCL